MRIPIREQLALLVLLSSLIALAVLAIATWVQNYRFVVSIRQSNLALTASLKAAQLSANLLLYQTTVQAMSTRILTQSALQRYNRGNNTSQNWSRAQSDLSSALSTGGARPIFLQAVVFPRDDSGLAGSSALLNVTADNVYGAVELPYIYPNGSRAVLGDAGIGYPPTLYPNLTYHPVVVNSTYNASHATYQGHEINTNDVLVIGPWPLNETFSLMSMTMSMNNNTSRSDIVGYITVLIDVHMLYSVLDSPEGLDTTGEVLIVAPDTSNNHFKITPHLGNPRAVRSDILRFALPPSSNKTLGNRHTLRAFNGGDPTLPFNGSSFPTVVDALTKDNKAVNNAGALISTNNEQGKHVSTGYATVNTNIVDWVLIFEQSHHEVVAPIVELRKIVIGCVFGTAGLLLILCFPIAHFGVRPIRQLRAATKKTVEPYIPEDASIQYDTSSTSSGDLISGDEENQRSSLARKEGFLWLIRKLGGGKRRRQRVGETSSSTRRRTFRIPGKVPQRKHWVKDELTDLTGTFNEMSDELVMQYERLEERVRERTAELEQSKKAAEAANESKTLFIANISHELKTPLNGILGMCAVSMQDTDLKRIRQSLGVIYKSGDLLLHLLTDLLTFSKNSIGQQLSLDEKEFRLSDISSQLMSIFEKQAKDKQINLKVVYQGTNDAFGKVSDDSEDNIYGPFGTGRVKDMCLWGDKNRILQVLINLTSNSLKFTPAGGVVEARVRCVGLELEDTFQTGSRKGSLQSKQSKHSKHSKHSKQSKNSKKRGRGGSDRSLARSADMSPNGDMNEKSSKELNSVRIEVDGNAKQIPQVAVRQRSQSPPPLNTKQLAFEFEVEDTGPGIPENQQQRVFEPFVQGDLGLSKKYGGTGLGLSICAQLAGLMGGAISLKSTVGIGSTFNMRIPLRWVKERSDSTSSSTFRLSSNANSIVGQSLYDEPRTPKRNDSLSDVSLHSTHSNHARAAEAAFESPSIDDQQPRLVGFSQPFFAGPVPAESPKPRKKDLKRAEEEAVRAGRKVRVLVAEDNKVNQQVVLRMLKLEDIYDVTVAKDGQEALDLVRDSMSNGERFDLVFMDIQMPNLDGIQSTKRLREMGFRAPIVALTAFSEESNVRECLSSGMDDFMPKPIKRPQLKAVIKKYCATIPEEDDADRSQPTGSRFHKESELGLAEASSSANGATKPNGFTENGRAREEDERPSRSRIEQGGAADSDAVSPLS